MKSSDLTSGSSITVNKSKTTEISSDEEESDIVQNFVALRELGGKGKQTKVTTSAEPEVERQQPAAKSPSKARPKRVPRTVDSDPEFITDQPAAKSTSNEDPPKVSLIAVAENVHGKKCYFRLVKMTKKEVDAIDETCIPYKLM